MTGTGCLIILRSVNATGKLFRTWNIFCWTVCKNILLAFAQAPQLVFPP
jgi:hypothetical protein